VAGLKTLNFGTRRKVKSKDLQTFKELSHLIWNE